MTKEDKRRKELLKEAESLGIIYIDGEPGISLGLLQDAVNLVKEMNIDFDKVAKECDNIEKSMKE